ncbi:hypothetical protein [Phaeodactylibacter xiamenensis]|uniref:hypothetical protein n=1 Tax=Phaeodactylibacter xiamenensis TaxID=1524460 RepID=UPI0024A9A39C|nr:hypothetical protein [Phaeodactylibacter xiamenensis]
MPQEVFITSNQHSNEELNELLSFMDLSQRPELKAKSPGTRSASEVLTFMAEHTEPILTVLGSLFTAWKLYQEQQKLRLERRKHELDAEKFEHEKAQWAAKQKAAQPKRVLLYTENGDELILPFGFEERELSAGQLKALREQSVSQLKGIAFE